MILTLVNVIYVLLAIAMIALILMQRGAGAAAGSGFGAGASATVFGARGSANFLSKSTAILATLFLLFSLGMAMYANRAVRQAAETNLGVMSQAPAAATPTQTPTVPAATTAAPASDVPVAPAAAVTNAPEGQPATAAPAPSDQAPAAPAAPATTEDGAADDDKR